MKFRKLTALTGAAMLVFAACSTPPAASTGASAPAASQPAASGPAESGPPASADTSKGTVKVAVALPYQGSEKAASEPIFNGIKLAVKEAGGAAGGYAIEIP